MNKYLLKAHYVPGISLRAGSRGMNKIENALAFIELTIY